MEGRILTLRSATRINRHVDIEKAREYCKADLDRKSKHAMLTNPKKEEWIEGGILFMKYSYVMSHGDEMFEI